MKIGMICLWNAANGPSIHAELLGRAWVKLGHQLKVFSATKHPDARPTFQEDEDFVIRHFRIDEVIPFTRATSFDPSPLLNEEYEIFVAQNVERLPAEKLLEVFPQIKKRAVTVQVVHEGKAPEDPLYYKFDWGDDTDSGWLGPYNSGDIVEASHSWDEKGNYNIRVIAKDENNKYSQWSEPLPISMPKNKITYLFFERVSALFQFFYKDISHQR